MEEAAAQRWWVRCGPSSPYGALSCCAAQIIIRAEIDFVIRPVEEKAEPLEETSASVRSDGPSLELDATIPIARFGI